jgi:hypothetical protein
MVTLLALVLAAEPHLSEHVTSARPQALSLHAMAGGAFGWAPGDRFTLNVGVRYRVSSWSFGLEVQPIMPGTVVVAAGEWPGFGKGLLRDEDIVASTRGAGVAGLLPVCFERSSLFVCGVAAGGGVQVDTVWQPLFSAGGRIGGEFPVGSPVRVRGSVQVLGGIVRPSAGTFWQASPVQLGVMAGLVSDVF